MKKKVKAQWSQELRRNAIFRLSKRLGILSRRQIETFLEGHAIMDFTESRLRDAMLKYKGWGFDQQNAAIIRQEQRILKQTKAKSC